jgi:dolichol-phosphate mannosyltransferase
MSTISDSLESRSSVTVDDAPRLSPELSVIIPTYNERENISPLVAALTTALDEIRWEAIFVDDNSPDGTGQCIHDIAVQDSRIRLVKRTGRRGLSSACIEGIQASSASYVAVIDADLQHDERILPRMLERLKSDNMDMVIATRRIPGGSMGEFSNIRVLLSRAGSWMSRCVSGHDVSDPMSGFFVVNRALFSEIAPRLSGTGFKILLDLLVSSPRHLRIAEVPYHFRNRQRGDSKLNLRVELQYLQFLTKKLFSQNL